MNLSVLGIDLAKRVFELHGVDARGECVLSRRVTRKRLLAVVAQLPRCLVVMEACGGAHYWAREIKQLGHELKLLKAQDVKGYIQGDKDDVHDAAGIAEAGTRAHLRSVPVNSVAQLIALAKARPGELNYASISTGSSNHLAAELLKSMANVDVVRVPYKTTPTAIGDLISGQEIGRAHV